MNETQFISSQSQVGYPLSGFSLACFSSPASFPSISLRSLRTTLTPPLGRYLGTELNLKGDPNKIWLGLGFFNPIYSGNTFQSKLNMLSELCVVWNFYYAVLFLGHSPVQGRYQVLKRFFFFNESMKSTEANYRVDGVFIMSQINPDV